jgi:predicted small metal-binding protein
MHVIECNICGETVSAADERELVGRLRDHLASEHEEEPGDEELERLVEDEAYEAMDS